MAIQTFAINIPPEYPEYKIETEHTFRQDIWIHSLYPHMHFRGSRMLYEAIYPDNTREVLLSVPYHRFHWQTSYQLAVPKRLPRGTRLVVRGAFDNSALNPDNPAPHQRVTWGEQSTDEMFMGYIEFSESSNAEP